MQEQPLSLAHICIHLCVLRASQVGQEVPSDRARWPQEQGRDRPQEDTGISLLE